MINSYTTLGCSELRIIFQEWDTFISLAHSCFPKLNFVLLEILDEGDSDSNTDQDAGSSEEEEEEEEEEGEEDEEGKSVAANKIVTCTPRII